MCENNASDDIAKGFNSITTDRVSESALIDESVLGEVGEGTLIDKSSLIAGALVAIALIAGKRTAIAQFTFLDTALTTVFF